MDDLVTVFRTGDAGLIAFVKSLLEGARIEYTTRGESVQNLFGYAHVGMPVDPIAGPVEFQVRPEDVERTRDLLKDVDSPPDDKR
jgi:hypothetical protein